jgi:hypothetical protein
MECNNLVSVDCGEGAAFISNGVIACVQYKRGEHTWSFAGLVESKQGLLRTLGQHASDLEDPFTWDDAVVVRDAINECWPEWCNCHACRTRRELDAEAKEMTEYYNQQGLGLKDFFKWLFGG